MMRCFNTTWGDVLGNLTAIMSKPFSTGSELDALSSKAQRGGFQLTAAGLVDNRFQLGYPSIIAGRASCGSLFRSSEDIKVICLGLRGCILEDGGVMSLARVTWLCWSWPEWDPQIKEPSGSCNLSSGEEDQEGPAKTSLSLIYSNVHVYVCTSSYTVAQKALQLLFFLKKWWLTCAISLAHNCSATQTPELWLLGHQSVQLQWQRQINWHRLFDIMTLKGFLLLCLI